MLHQLQQALRQEGVGEKNFVAEALNYALAPPPQPAHAQQDSSLPRDAPKPKPWHVERPEIVTRVLETFSCEKGSRVVGLVGESGSGKTTLASQIVRDQKVQKVFPDGIVWLDIGVGGEDRLPLLLNRLAELVYEDIDGLRGEPPVDSEDFDGAAFVKRLVEEGHGGQGLKCLIVADNVWEPEVVRQLRDTSMSILVTAKVGQLKTDVMDEEHEVGSLTVEQAKQLLRGAAELSSNFTLPEKVSSELISLCGGMALDLEFIGRWSALHGRKDEQAWSNAVGGIQTQQLHAKDGGARSEENASKIRRQAVLAAGYEDLIATTADASIKKMFLSLAVIPDGHTFTAHDAVVLFHGSCYCIEDKAAVKYLLNMLVHRTILDNDGEIYRMHDAYMAFSREKLVAEGGDIQLDAIRSWTNHISSMPVLRSTESVILSEMWSALESVGGESWEMKRPYVKALDEMDDSKPSWREYAEALAQFQATREDWHGARMTGRKLLEVEKRDLGPDHPFVVNTLNFLAGCAELLGDSKDAEQLHKIEREVSDSILARTSAQTSVARRQLEGIRPSPTPTMGGLTSDELRGTEAVLRRLLSFQEAELGADDLQLAYTMHKLAACIGEMSRHGEAEKLLWRALEIEIANLDKDNEQVASTLYDLGVYIQQAGRLDEAENLLRRALAIEETKLGEDDPKIASTLHSLGMCVKEAGRLEEAELFLRRAVDIKMATLGRDDMQLTYTLHSLGVCMREAGRLDESEALLRRALDIEEAKLGEHHEQVAYTLHELGVCIGEAGRLEEAEKQLKRALDIETAKLGEDDIQVAYTLHEFGVLLLRAGRLDEAEAMLIRAVDIKQGDFVRNETDVAATIEQLGVCVGRAGRYEEAEELLKNALEVYQEEHGKDDVCVAETLHHLGVLLEKVGGRQKEAEDYLRRSLKIFGA